MKFSKVIGKNPEVTPEIIKQAEKRLSSIFVDLSLGYDNKALGSGLGGDPFIFSLLHPIEHICDLSLPTAATNGRRFFWNPLFILKLSKIGGRIVASHEGWHAIYMHPARRAGRLPKLWNISVDFKVNATIIQDFKAREIREPEKLFKEHLGEFMTLDEYSAFLSNPFKPPAKLAHMNPLKSLDFQLKHGKTVATEKKSRRNKNTHGGMFFADGSLPDNMKKPENIYDHLLGLLPRCAECGKVGMYAMPKINDNGEIDPNFADNYGKYLEEVRKNAPAPNMGKGCDVCCPPPEEQDDSQSQQGEGDGEGESEDNTDSDGNGGNGDKQSKGDKPGKGKGNGKGGKNQSQDDKDDFGDGKPNGYFHFDPFGIGDTLDEHMDTEVDEDALGKRLSDAAEACRRIAGKTPAGVEDELGQLLKPRLTWQDFIRGTFSKIKKGKGRNDWGKPRTRPMFAGIFAPKKKQYYVNFICALDTSGSMSVNDMALLLSQLQALDGRAEGWVCCFDTEAYFDKATKIQNANMENLAKTKVVGRGGTAINDFFNNYEEKLGKTDLIICATDGYLYDRELLDCRQPKCQVVWIVTNHESFVPPFGRVFHINNERI